jgi:hypothetical protein
VCAKGERHCVGFPARALPYKETPPDHPLADAPSLALHPAIEPERMAKFGSRAAVVADPKRWAALTGPGGVESLWTSADGTRALIRREHGTKLGGPSFEGLSFVDLATHVVLDQASMCGDFVGADAVVDDGATVLLARYFIDDHPNVTVALVDLALGRFVAINPEGKPLASTTCTKRASSPHFATGEAFGELVDARHRRTSTALLTLEGKRVATLDGDFPTCEDEHMRDSRRALVVNDATQIVVTESANLWADDGDSEGDVCVGRMRILPETSTSAHQPPRCLGRCAESAGALDPKSRWAP